MTRECSQLQDVEEIRKKKEEGGLKVSPRGKQAKNVPRKKNEKKKHKNTCRRKLNRGLSKRGL